MAEPLSLESQLALIKANLAEVLNPEIIEDTLKQGKPLKIYWGTAPTGRPHCGYFVPILKLAQFLQAGCSVKILFADIHAFLDIEKATMPLVEFRAEYYKFVITALLKAVKAPIDRLEFVLGSSFQSSRAYSIDLMRLSKIVSVRNAKRAGSEVVKQSDDAIMSSLIYPLMQVLDEEHLDVDAQFGGVDQRKIFVLAKETLPRLGYKARAHLMNPMVPGLQGGKMSASDAGSKIDLLDTPEVVRKKLKSSLAAPKIVKGNGILSFVEFVLLPASRLRYGTEKFFVERGDDTPLEYTNIADMHKDYENDVLSPQHLKHAVTEALISLLEPMQAEFQASPAWQEVEAKAYPPSPVPLKQEKKKKDKGSFYPKKVSVGEDGGAQALEKLSLQEK